METREQKVRRNYAVRLSVHNEALKYVGVGKEYKSVSALVDEAMDEFVKDQKKKQNKD